MRGHPLSVHIQFDHITVTSINTTSGIFVGTNQSFGWSSHAKSNTGLSVSGTHNAAYFNTSIVYDPDVIDTPIDDRDIMVGAPLPDPT